MGSFLVRFMLAVQRRIVRETKASPRLLDPKHSQENGKSDDVYDISTSEGSVQMATWLLRSTNDGVVQLVTKVRRNESPLSLNRMK